MSQFIQLHLLTSYPPSNLNRDDLGQPKTAMMGGHKRLRISSQSLKRAWRTSDLFKTSLKGHIGERTKKMGVKIFEELTEGGINETDAKKWSHQMIQKIVTGSSSPEKEKSKKSEQKKEKTLKLETEQLVHYSSEEKQQIDKLCEILIKEKRAPKPEELDNLQKKHETADIALFGRMLASNIKCNTEAAVQVAHAISTHAVVLEDDFFTAIDDLNEGEEEAGAGHLGVTEFSAGLFYLYICIDKDSLIANLSGNKELANKTLEALVKTSAKISPTGKQNSFASRSYADYIRCEVGTEQARSLSVAFLEPVKKGNMLEESIKKLEQTASNIDKVYGQCFENLCVMNVPKGEGSLEKIIECVMNA